MFANYTRKSLCANGKQKCLIKVSSVRIGHSPITSEKYTIQKFGLIIISRWRWRIANFATWNFRTFGLFRINTLYSIFMVNKAHQWTRTLHNTLTQFRELYPSNRQTRFPYESFLEMKNKPILRFFSLYVHSLKTLS